MLVARCAYVAAVSAMAVQSLRTGFRQSLRSDQMQQGSVHSGPSGYDPSLIAVDFAFSTVTCNNLGGKGPDVDCGEMIYYQNISIGYDLMLVATSQYVPKNTDNNGLDGDFGILNLNKDQHVDIVATLIDASTGVEVSRGKSFYLTIWDMDQGSTRDDGTAKLVENVTVSPIHQWMAVPNPEFDAYEVSEDKYSFVSKSYGNSDNNPTDQWVITEEQERRAVAVYIERQTTFYLTLTTSGGGSGGRNTMLGGNSWLTNHLNAKPAPCDDFSNIFIVEDMLGVVDMAHSGIRYQNATMTSKGEHADMVVSANGRYVAWDPNMNGVFGKCGEINEITRNLAAFTVNFYVPGTSDPLTIERFFFSILDLDATHNGVEVFRIANTSFSSYYHSETTELNISSTADGMMTFAGTKYGTQADNPTDPRNLSSVQQDRSVSFFMENANEFNFWWSVQGAWTGRNLLFAGATNVACPAQLR